MLQDKRRKKKNAKSLVMCLMKDGVDSPVSHRAQRSAPVSSPSRRTCPTLPMRSTRSRTPCTSSDTSSPCKHRLTISFCPGAAFIRLESRKRRVFNRRGRECDSNDLCREGYTSSKGIPSVCESLIHVISGNASLKRARQSTHLACERECNPARTS